jgi:hypothetical protein
VNDGVVNVGVSTFLIIISVLELTWSLHSIVLLSFQSFNELLNKPHLNVL